MCYKNGGPTTVVSVQVDSMFRYSTFLQLLAMALVLVACGGGEPNGEAEPSRAGSSGPEDHGTVEFDGVTYEITDMNCRQGRWHASSDQIYFRVNSVTGAGQDYDRYNLALTRHPDGQPGQASDTWRMVYGAREFQPEAEVTDQGIRGSGVVHLQGETNVSINDERLKPVHFDIRC